MGAEKYLSVKKFAETAHVSPQSIYHRLEKDLKPYLKFDGKVRKLSTKALALFAPPATNKSEKIKETQKEPENVIFKLIKPEDEQDLPNKRKPVFEVMLLSLKNQLEIKDTQLQEKDKQIETITKALLNAQLNANQAQVLHAETIKQIPSETPSEKKGLFSNWFK